MHAKLRWYVFTLNMVARCNRVIADVGRGKQQRESHTLA
jgi:hypothetical protein